jgi:hypothetical protein
MKKAKAAESASELPADDVLSNTAAENAMPDVSEHETKEAPEPEVIPSWFSRTYGERSTSDMAEDYAKIRPIPPPPVVAEGSASYDAYRKRLEERFANARRMTDPDYAAQAYAMQNVAFPDRPRFAQQQPPRKVAARPFGLHISSVVALALGACALGSGLGYVIANPSDSRLVALQSASWITDLLSGKPQVTPETVIAKKPVRSARIQVKDASGAINAPIPLDIDAVPADPETPVAFRITGLPPSAYLTKGYEISEGEWMLKAGDMAQAELIVPHTTTPELALQVAALEEKTGAPAAPSQTFTVTLDTEAVPVPGVPQPQRDQPVVTPVSGEPNLDVNKAPLPVAIPVPLESTNPEVQNLIVKGDTLLGNGDVLAARQFYLRAYQLKATTAAYGVGQTYDPAVYAKHKIKGLAPDIQTAAEWYGKAAAGGYELATQALEDLPVQP